MSRPRGAGSTMTGLGRALRWVLLVSALLLPVDSRGQQLAQPAARRPLDRAAFRPRTLSPFQRRQVEWLLRERLPCLGCHRLRGEGGAIGPDLTEVASRRTAGFIYGMVADPAATLPGSRMPRTPMPPRWVELVTQYLVSLKGPGSETAVDPPGTPGASGWSAIRDPAELYREACAACHGTEGKGDGYNARNLPVRPTAHADSAYMATRPDDTLFDGIFAGGYILNKSARMPAFGASLSREQIWGLVRYLRQLCGCGMRRDGERWGGTLRDVERR